jgi:exopolyphosphatase/guanosine-5'-triphosphate,3'-diphosphate pyrophosphatase
MPRIAAFDLGTNTFLCLVADVSGQGEKRRLQVFKDYARVVRLGEKVHQERKFSDEALKRADQCLSDFSKFVKESQVDFIIATATSAARDVSNGSKLIEMGAKYSIPIKIIPGPKEAQLSFAGAVSALPEANQRNILVIDVGGGSTELIFRKAHEDSINGKSFDVGAVRLTEMFLKSDPISEVEYNTLVTHADEILKAYGSVKPDLVIAVAGTPTTLACVAQDIDFVEDKVEGFILSQYKLRSLIKSLGALTIDQRKRIKGMVPERADVIIAGAAILERCLELTPKTDMRVSTRGLRFGAALHYEEFL